MDVQSDMDKKFARLRDSLAKNDEKGVQDAIFDLSAWRNNWRQDGDSIVERLLGLLSSKEIYDSLLAGHLLMFFEFESGRLTDRQKWLCIDFLNAHGDQFADGFASQMVWELRCEQHLLMKRTNEARWKDWLKMKEKCRATRV